MPIRNDGQSSAVAGLCVRGLAARWEQTVFLFGCVAIGFLGVGRVEISILNSRLSSWSVSRTVFFFWLIWKLLVWIQYGWAALEWRRIAFPHALLFFFVFVTASLFPYFRQPGDYRYLLFGFFHYIVVADLFSRDHRPSLLLVLLGVIPGFLLARGLASDPSVFNLSRAVRFGYPLDHPNTAGYLFSMGIPLSLAAIVNWKGWIRGLSQFSLGAQLTGLVLTYSRGAWLGSLVSLLSLALVERRLIKAVAFLALVVLLGLLILHPVRDRLVSLFDVMQDPNVAWRMDVMVNTVSAGMERPFLGAGYGREHLRSALAQKYPDFFQQRFIPHSHNMYTELFCGAGFLGLGTFLWLLVSTLVHLFHEAMREEIKERKIVLCCLAASLLAFMVCGLGDVPFYHHETRIFFFTLLALISLHLPARAIRRTS